MNVSDMMSLANLLDPEDENGEFSTGNEVQNKGSVFAPSDVGNGGAKKKELAKPFAPIQVKVGDKTEQTQQQLSAPQPQQKPKQKSKNDIWDVDEVQVQSKPVQDDRKRPEIDVMYKQIVGTEDVFGGWSGIDPSSTKCQALLVKITLPNTRYAEINLEVLKQEIVVSSIQYYLNYILPYPVNDKLGKAKWISDKFILELELPIVREEYY